ncbi:VOC family protein [Cylindrospermum sp. FACHB-282]|nr:VOC family protein [Cylindrospermum sp. FACHB-282]
MQKLQRVIIGLLLTVFLAIGFSTPVYAQSQNPLAPAGYLFRINVSTEQRAINFYHDILGMTKDTEKSVCSPEYCWLEFFAPNKEDVRIATQISSTTGTGKAVITIVVDDVNNAKAYLESSGISVSEIQEPGKKVRLAFFNDFDGNRLAIRDEKGRI